MTSNERLAYRLFSNTLTAFAVSPWDPKDPRDNLVGTFAGMEQAICQIGTLAPIEAHVAFWSQTGGLGAVEYENQPSVKFSDVVDTLSGALYNLVKQTEKGDRYLNTLEAYNAVEERKDYLLNNPSPPVIQFPELGEAAIPAMGPNPYAVVKSVVSAASASAVGAGSLFAPNRASWPTGVFGRDGFDPVSVRQTAVCECGAHATGAPIHSSWCPMVAV